MYPLRLLAPFALASSLAFADAPQVVELWPEGVPGLRPDASSEKLVNGRITNIHKPCLLVFPAAREKSKGTAIILSSGGGYARIAINPKGDAMVRYLNELGITVFVIKYRLSDYGHPAPFQATAVQNRICWADRSLNWRDLGAVFSGFPDGCPI